MKPQRVSDLRVLCIDDDPFQLETLKIILDDLGVGDVLLAETQVDALAMVAADPVDIVMLDLNMPDGSGIEFLNALGKTPFAGGIAIVSGADEIVIKSATKLAKAWNHEVLGAVTKPFAIPDLRDILAKALA